MSEESNDMFNAIKLELEGLSPDFTPVATRFNRRTTPNLSTRI